MWSIDSWVLVIWDPYSFEQRDACENIFFRQLCLWAVKNMQRKWIVVTAFAIALGGHFLFRPKICFCELYNTFSCMESLLMDLRPSDMKKEI